jgi:hypothetical protein
MWSASLEDRKRIQITMLARTSIICATIFSSALAQSLSGIWGPSSDKTRLFSTTSFDDFTKTWFANDKAGYIMHDFEMLVPKSGTPTFYGLSRSGPAAANGYSAGWIVADWANFTGMWDYFETLGLLMHDFESYEIAGTQWYAGVYHPVKGKKQKRHFTTNAADAENFRQQAVKDGYLTQD